MRSIRLRLPQLVAITIVIALPLLLTACGGKSY
jgi:hypothetical protein